MKKALYFSLLLTVIGCFNSCSTEGPQERWNAGSGSGSRGENPEEEINFPAEDGVWEENSDHLFKYEEGKPDLEVSSDGTTIMLTYEKTKVALFLYLVCRDVLAENASEAIEYDHDREWYQYQNSEALYPRFKYMLDVDFFSPGDVIGLDCYNDAPKEKELFNQRAKKFTDANIGYADTDLGYKIGETSIEIKAGEDEWITAVIDRENCTVTFTIEPNDSGEPRCFTFVMGGWLGNPPTEFLDNGVIVHQAAR